MIVALPAPKIDTVMPLTVATAGFELVNATAKPEVEEAVRLKLGSLNVTAVSAAKVIVWSAFAICRVPVAVPA